MRKLRAILRRLLAPLGEQRTRPRAEGGKVRHERVTVMLVPSAAWGKPLQFQTTKRMLLTLLVLGSISFVLVVLGGLYLTGWAVLHRRPEVYPWANALEKETEISTLKEENRQLKVELKSQVDETQQRIAKVNRLIGKISSFTGLPLEELTSGPATLTSASAQLQRSDALGRGGPYSPFPPRTLTRDIFGYGERSFGKIREIQLYELDSVVYRLDRAARHFGDQQELLGSTPLICPVQGEFTFTDRFGKRLHPLLRRLDFHEGLDISSPHGTPIVAPADGKITFAGSDKAKGLTLTIDHGDGLYPRDGVPSKRHFKTRYFHCSRILLKTGARVKRGDVIALVGSSGLSTGNHCHYEVLVDDQLVDPETLILNSR